MFNYDFSVPEAKDAIFAEVSHPTYKLKWVPPDNRSEVSQAFVEAVAMMDTASTTVAESTSSQLIAGLEGDDDYGYGENNCSSLAVASSTSQVKAEAVNFLPEADKSLSRLHFFPAVQRLFLKFNTARPLLTTLSFHSLSLLIISSSVSAITSKSSAYSSSHGRATLNSLDMASMTIMNNSGLNAEPWCITTFT